MQEIIDKLVLLLCTSVVYLIFYNSYLAVVPFILGITLSSLFLYLDYKKLHLFGTLFFGLICIMYPPYILYLPLILYDTLCHRYQYMVALLPFLILFHWGQFDGLVIIIACILTVLSFILRYKTIKINGLNKDYNDLRDSFSSFSKVLEDKNRALQESQEYEIHLATLNERNRIARELHDNLGHMLSRSLLQVGALLITSKDPVQKEALSNLKNSLSSGMDDIRSSIHQMYDNSIDLYAQIEEIIKNFDYCPIQLDYDISVQPPLNLRHSFIIMIKESLSNVMKHSKCDKVSITLREHPGLYQLVVEDNGFIQAELAKQISNYLDHPEEMQGMGLKNIIDRVNHFHGYYRIATEQGFKVFITIPKKQNL